MYYIFNHTVIVIHITYDITHSTYYIAQPGNEKQREGSSGTDQRANYHLKG